MSLAVEESKADLDSATILDMEGRTVRETLCKRRSATFISVQRTVFGMFGGPGASAANPAVAEEGPDIGFAFHQNTEAKCAWEMMKKLMNATLGPVQLMVSGVPGLSGIAAAEHVEVDINQDSGHVPHHNMEAIIAGEILGRIGPATPTPVKPSSLPKRVYPGTVTYLIQSLLVYVW